MDTLGLKRLSVRSTGSPRFFDHCLDVLLDKITVPCERLNQTRKRFCLRHPDRDSALPARNQPAIRRAAQVWTSPVYSRRQRSPQWHWTVVVATRALLSRTSNSGIQFQTLDGISIPGRITSLEDYQHAGPAELYRARRCWPGRIDASTVEHLMAALSMAGLVLC